MLRRTPPVNWRHWGYTNVRDYAAGKQDWIDAELTTESEHKH